MTRATRLERALVRTAIAALLLLIACDDDPTPVQRLLEEGFEASCEGLPCGWTRIAGAEDQATWATTFHPGDHAVVLVGSGVAVRGPGGESRAASLTLGSVRAELAARCDPGNTLDVSLSLVDAAGTPPAFADVLTGRVSPPRTWDAGSTPFVLTASTGLADGGLGTGFSYVVRIAGVTIAKTGPGRCEVSQMTVDDVNAASSDLPGCD